MSKELPHHNFLAEPLQNGLSVNLYTGESATSNPRQLFFESHYSSMSSKPLPRPPDRHVPPSTRPQTHPCTTRHECGHSGQGSSRLSEEVRAGHTSCTTIGGISFAPMPGYLANLVPGWQSASISISINANRCKAYLVCHVDKDLCVRVPKEVDHVPLILTRSDRLQEGGKFMWCKKTSDQTSAG